MKTNMVLMKATTLKMAIRLAKKSGLRYCAIIKKEGEYEIDPTVGLDKKGARAALIKGKLWKRVVEEGYKQT